MKAIAERLATEQAKALESQLVRIAGVSLGDEYENIAWIRLRSINVKITEFQFDGGSDSVIQSDLGDLAVVKVVFDKGVFSKILQPLDVLPWPPASG